MNRTGWIAALALSIAMSSGAAPTAEPDSPLASQIFRQMSDYLAQAKHLRFHAETLHDELAESGMKMQIAGAGDVAVARPNRLFAEFRDDLSARTLWYDGKQATLYDPTNELYATAEVSKDVDPMLDDLEARYGVRLPLGELISESLHEDFSRRSVKGSYFGIHDVEGIACHHLGFELDRADVQFWVELGDAPLPRKIVIDYRDEPSSPQYIAVLMDWSLDGIDGDVFEPDLPKEARRIEFLPRRQGASQ